MLLDTTKFPWFPQNEGFKVHIDEYGVNFPTETIASIDIETNGKEVTDRDFKIVCIGVCGNGTDAYIYFTITEQLINYLHTVRFVAQDGKRAEIPWLSSFGVTIDQLYFDTKIGAYVYDSARKNYSLKPLIKDLFNVEYPTYDDMITNPEMIQATCELDPSLMVPKKKGLVLPKEVTLDKMPKDYVAAYNSLDCIYQFKLWTWLRQHYSVAQTEFLTNIELPMTRLLYQTEKQGVKIDITKIRQFHKQFSKARRQFKKEFSNLTQSSINLNSPKQVLETLQSNGLGVKSTNENTLKRYEKNPIVKSLLEYRGYQKLCSTYTIPLYFNAIKDANQHIYARFSQNTITGRLSSSDPINLQNQPPEVREAFIADVGYKFINADWSNIELRLPAHFSGEPKLINEYLKPDGGDVHTVTAKLIFGESVESLSNYKEKRSIAKTCNFLLTNSGTARRLANELNVHEKEAERLFEKFWEGYPILAAWLKYEKQKARANKGVTDWFGRWVPIPQLILTCGNWNCAKLGKFCKNCFMREEAERSAMSILIQGTASSMCKLAALRIYKEYKYVPNLLVHDELNYQIKDEQVNEALEKIKNCMENIVSLKVPLVVDIGVGKSWKEAKGK